MRATCSNNGNYRIKTSGRRCRSIFICSEVLKFRSFRSSRSDLNIAEDTAKILHKSASMAYHDAKINSADPIKFLPPQKPPLKLVTRRNIFPVRRDIIPCVASPNSPKSAKIYSPNTHPHGAPPTRMSHKLGVAPMPSATILDDAPSALAPFVRLQEHYLQPCRLLTYR